MNFSVVFRRNTKVQGLIGSCDLMIKKLDQELALDTVTLSAFASDNCIDIAKTKKAGSL